MRQRGEDVFFLTGTDEHGEPGRSKQAEARGHTGAGARRPHRRHFKELARELNASNDFFIRTTDAGHEAIVQEIVQRVYDNGHVYEGTTRAGTARAAPTSRPSPTDRRATPARSTRSRSSATRRTGSSACPRFQERARRLYDRARRTSSDPRLRCNEALSFIAAGLQGRLALAADAEVGRAAALGPDAGDLRLVRRAAQLLHGADYAREGEDLTERFWPATCTSSPRTSSSSTPSTGRRC